MQKPGIGDDADNGAEQRCDQDVARRFVNLGHDATMRDREPAIKLQLIQNALTFTV